MPKRQLILPATKQILLRCYCLDSRSLYIYKDLDDPQMAAFFSFYVMGIRAKSNHYDDYVSQNKSDCSCS
ncbi:hypothetical protein OUZ56_014009 [Daphnia magna]|uniref:Uncharacterized protein n=1 Tax=Daphnia magna TaxID=35525 RepID=A0ABQ9Z7L1_9CRUS|nr:hypothetical protein OUZ56_014009 [Daphnia magna]